MIDPRIRLLYYILLDKGNVLAFDSEAFGEYLRLILKKNFIGNTHAKKVEEGIIKEILRELNDGS